MYGFSTPGGLGIKICLPMAHPQAAPCESRGPQRFVVVAGEKAKEQHEGSWDGGRKRGKRGSKKRDAKRQNGKAASCEAME